MPERASTEDRLLDGALRAVARHGLAKVGMGDVSEHAGVSRGTAYRYFGSRDELLARLGRREAERFEREVWELLERTPRQQRLAAALDLAARLAREHPLLQRLPETDPGLVLTALRERFPGIRSTFRRLLGPYLAETRPVRDGLVTVDQLVDWATRILISTFLFPDASVGSAADGFAAVYGAISREPASPDPDPQRDPDPHPTSPPRSPDEENDGR